MNKKKMQIKRETAKLIRSQTLYRMMISWRSELHAWSKKSRLIMRERKKTEVSSRGRK